MASPNLQLEGGNFQNAAGAVVAGGQLLFTLSHDESYASGPSQIVAGQKFTVTLDNSGNIPVSPAFMVYDNADLLPSGSFYTVRLFDATGAEVWASPQNWVLAATPNPLNVATIVPASPPGTGLSGGGGSTLLLQTDETNNGSQSLLDLHAGSNITLTDNGSGRVTIASSGGSSPSFSTHGYGGFVSAGFSMQSGNMASPTQTTIVTEGTANKVIVWQFTNDVSWTIRSVSCYSGSGATGHANFGIYDSTLAKVLDSGALTLPNAGLPVSNSITGVVIGPGTYYFAGSQDDTSSTIYAIGGFVNVFVDLLEAVPGGITRNAIAANSTSGGVMPATLGSLTPLNSGNAVLMPFVFFGV